MNNVSLMGRLAADPETRYTQGDNSIAVCRYTLAVDRAFKRDGEQAADFIRCVCFKGAAEFASKYFHRGMKVAVTGSIRTGSYVDRAGQKVYTTEVAIAQQYFCEGREANERYRAGQAGVAAGKADVPAGKPGYGDGGGFMAVPDGLPFDC